MKRPGRIAKPTFLPGELRIGDRAEPVAHDLPDQGNEGVDVALVVTAGAEQRADVEDCKVVEHRRRGRLYLGRCLRSGSGEGGRQVLADGGQHLVGIDGFGDEAVHPGR
ncbi:hypothetical protein D3C81_1928100 [compost metagenome]